jgi:hypothetical protein
MPLTFLSHQAIVLPIKIKAPNVTSGTALVLGSMSPDVEYFLNGYPTGTISHTWLGLFIFCLPVTLALYWVVTRIVAAPLAAHLPDGGNFRLRDYALVARPRGDVRHWGIVGVSSLIGAASHIVLDRLSGGWGRTPSHFGSWIPYDLLPSGEAWIAAKIITWIALGAVCVLLLRHIGRHRLLQRWAAQRGIMLGSGAGPAVAPEDRVLSGARRAGTESRGSGRSGAAFWLWIVLGGLVGAGLGAVYRLPAYFMHQPATWVHIWLCSVSGTFIGLVIASAAWQARHRGSVHLRGIPE